MRCRCYILTFAIALLQPFFLSAQQQPMFLFHPETQAYLQYFCIVNTFDSSATQYRFGEVAVHSNNGIAGVLLSETLAPMQEVHGQTGQGEDIQLRSHARTQSFSLVAGQQISWFGELMSYRRPCDDGGTSGGGEPNKPTAAWQLLDRSEFVVELIAKSNNARLAVLDSIGVHPPAQTGVSTDTRYGTDPHIVVKYYTVPQALDGREAYIRISPRRYGPTPLGMDLGKEENWVNYSAYYDSTYTTFISPAAYSALSAACFNSFLLYCDSVRSATGRLPNYEKFTFSGSEGAIFRARYNIVEQTTSAGQRYWQEPPPSGKEPARAYPVFTHSITVVRGILSRVTVSPNPVITDEVTVHVDASLSVPVQILAYTMNGEAAGHIWSGELHSGTNTVTVTLPPVGSGNYLLVIENDNGQAIGYTSVTIEK